MAEFSDDAPSAPAVFYRSYSRRKKDGSRENFREAIDRTVTGIADIGGLKPEWKELCLEQARNQHCFPSGRALWVSGTEWGQDPDNSPGFYNCCSMHVDRVEAFGDLMRLAMMGTGTGAVLEKEVVQKLPPVKQKIRLINTIKNEGKKGGSPLTSLKFRGSTPGATLVVGDSRDGWADAYEALIQIALKSLSLTADWDLQHEYPIVLDLSQVRQAGEPLKGFGGTANPVRLEEMFHRVVDVLNRAVGRKLTPLECCLLIDEAATCVVAGNIRRSAGMRQFSYDDTEASTAKDNLYTQDANGNWKVDAEKEALRMANHTRCFHHKPTLEEIKDSVTRQYWSGEGAIQYVPEMVARANADILYDDLEKEQFLKAYDMRGSALAKAYLSITASLQGIDLDERELSHRMARYGLNPCGEIALKDNLCNLSEVHLNTIEPDDDAAQWDAFYAGGLQVACLLQQKFPFEELQYSREIDPIVGVSFTGLFDFFVKAFGVHWLDWMMEGCPYGESSKHFSELEADYLYRWKEAAWEAVIAYCREHNIRYPNRFTTVQPAGSKSLLTGASPGWHPPKAQRFIRRITFGKDDPLVSALRDYGYNVIPAQSARDDEGNLLDDINDPRVQEVLVEIPTEVCWANLPGCDKYDLSKLPVRSQWRLYMQVQNNYTMHNTSATLELREDEIDELSELIYHNIHSDGGYISAALLARFDANETFPRLPFEPIDKYRYQTEMKWVHARRKAFGENLTVLELLAKYDNADYELKGAAGCDSDKCLSEEAKAAGKS